MIAIVDYGLGNIASVQAAIARLGFEPSVVSDPDRLAEAEKLILPGVGAFGDGMSNLRQRGLIEPLNRLVLERKVPLLGICLGFQLIAKESEEFGQHAGLGWVDANIVRLAPQDAKLRVPHVGWNNLLQRAATPLFEDIPHDALFYYVHSYRMVANNDDIVGECDYGGPFPSVLSRGNIHAVQFHPEKSQRHGLTLLRNFLKAA